MKQKQETVKAWFGSGSPWVWMNAGAVSIAVIMTIGLLAVIAVRGLGHFWPANVIEATYQIPGEAAKTVIGEVVQAEEVPRARLRSAGMPVPEAGPEFMTRELLKLGNRELYGSDFSWVVGEWLQDIKRPEALMVLERREWGNFYGYLLSVKENGQVVAEGDAAVGELQKRMQRVDDLYAKLYKLEKGVAEGSFGMHCASMCGIPNKVIERAEVAAKQWEHTSRLKESLERQKGGGYVGLGWWSDVAWALRDSTATEEAACDVSDRGLEVLRKAIEAL